MTGHSAVPELKAYKAKQLISVLRKTTLLTN